MLYFMTFTALMWNCWLVLWKIQVCKFVSQTHNSAVCPHTQTWK